MSELSVIIVLVLISVLAPLASSVWIAANLIQTTKRRWGGLSPRTWAESIERSSLWILMLAAAGLAVGLFGLSIASAAALFAPNQSPNLGPTIDFGSNMALIGAVWSGTLLCIGGPIWLLTRFCQAVVTRRRGRNNPASPI